MDANSCSLFAKPQLAARHVRGSIGRNYSLAPGGLSLPGGPLSSSGILGSR